jgi:hypothetical protein
MTLARLSELAALAKAQGVTVSVTVGGRVYTISPAGQAEPQPPAGGNSCDKVFG